MINRVKTKLIKMKIENHLYRSILHSLDGYKTDSCENLLKLRKKKKGKKKEKRKKEKMKIFLKLESSRRRAINTKH